MRYYLYILLILIFSCQEIQENVEALPYDFLISEGWINFEDGDFESSEDLFLDILDSEDSMVPYYSEAYLGLGWTKLYQAKELSGNPIDEEGNPDVSLQNLRIDARDYFISILEECGGQNENEECEGLDIPEDLMSDAYAGLAYANSLIAMYEDFYYGEEQYICSLDEERYLTLAECENSCGVDLCDNTYLSLTEVALEYSGILLENNSNYYFTHDPDNINANSVHLLRAQLYIDIGEYDQAQQEISQVDFSSSSITFTLEDSYEDQYNSYDRYIHVGFEGDNNSKHYIPMETELLYYDCHYSCDSITDQDNCLDGCEWLADMGCQEDVNDMYADFNLCETSCVEGECQGVYSSSVTATFTPLLPCLYTYGTDIEIEMNLTDEEVVQCLESFPTHTLEYKFAIQFPSSILEGYGCSNNDEDDISTIYPTEELCEDNCGDGECQIVDYDIGNCQAQYSNYEFIDGIGCIDGYMYFAEEFEDDSCSENGYRFIEIEDSGASVSLSSSFGLCTSN